MSTSDRKREANKRNAQKSTGPKTSIGKAHSGGNAVKRGTYSRRHMVRGENQKEFRQLKKDLRQAVPPGSAFNDYYFNRLYKIGWAERQVERAISSLIETAACERQIQSNNGSENDDYLISLIPDVKQALARKKAQSTDSRSVTTPSVPMVQTQRFCGASDIDQAVAEGIAPVGQGGRLSQLRHELRMLQRDFDRTLKIFLAFQMARRTIDVLPHPTGEGS
jgi:hypothetical protein